MRNHDHSAEALVPDDARFFLLFGRSCSEVALKFRGSTPKMIGLAIRIAGLAGGWARRDYGRITLLGRLLAE